MKKFLAALVPIVCLALIPGIAKADTLTLLGATPNPSGGSAEIYPYTFSAAINGVTSTENLMCLNYNREITVGETWTINELSIPTGNTALDTDYRADALLYYLMLNPGITGTTYSASDIQYADWSILDPGAVAGNSLFDSTALTLASEALADANNQTLIGSGFFNQFTLYIPTDDTASGPQEFIGTAPLTTTSNVTPEPTSLALFGSGLIGLAGLARRRFNRA